MLMELMGLQKTLPFGFSLEKLLAYVMPVNNVTARLKLCSSLVLKLKRRKSVFLMMPSFK